MEDGGWCESELSHELHVSMIATNACEWKQSESII